MKYPCCALGLILAASPLAAQEEPALPSWLAGCWEASDGERWTEECWTAPRAGMMMGSGRSGNGDALLGWETMRIVLDYPGDEGPVTRMAYIAAPQGQEATVFGGDAASAEEISFANAAHDYPQRIRYWREGDLLKAETSLLDGSRSRIWTFERRGGS